MWGSKILSGKLGFGAGPLVLVNMTVLAWLDCTVRALRRVRIDK